MRYLGVDFGLRRVGLARSEGQLASPWKVIEGKGLANIVAKIKKEARGFDRVVVGVPEGKMGKIVRKVAKILRESGSEVMVVDETLSSQHATTLMVELDLPRKKRAVNDAYSAAIILQNYLDNP